MIEAIPKTSIPSTSFAFPGLPQRHDHPREPCLLSREGGWQDAAYGPETTIQPELIQQGASPHHPLVVTGRTLQINECRIMAHICVWTVRFGSELIGSLGGCNER